jgi:hypothetical protein
VIVDASEILKELFRSNMPVKKAALSAEDEETPLGSQRGIRVR